MKASTILLIIGVAAFVVSLYLSWLLFGPGQCPGGCGDGVLSPTGEQNPFPLWGILILMASMGISALLSETIEKESEK